MFAEFSCKGRKYGYVICWTAPRMKFNVRRNELRADYYVPQLINIAFIAFLSCQPVPCLRLCRYCQLQPQPGRPLRQ